MLFFISGSTMPAIIKFDTIMANRNSNCDITVKFLDSQSSCPRHCDWLYRNLSKHNSKTVLKNNIHELLQATQEKKNNR